MFTPIGCSGERQGLVADDADIHRLIARIYELGLEADLWPQLLDEIAAFYRCSKSAYMHVAHDDSVRVMSYFRHPEPDAPKVLNSLQTYSEMPPGSDIWLEIGNISERRWVGAVLCNEFVPIDEVVRSDHYNLVVKEAGCFDNLGMRVADEADYGSYLSVYSDGPQRIFTKADIALHQLLHPHLKRVVDLQSKFRHDLRAAALRGAALDQLDSAVFLVTAAGKIMFANVAAAALLKASDGLEKRGGRLVHLNPVADAQIERALQRACGIGSGGAPTGSGFAITRAPPRSPLGAQILPFDPGCGDDPFARFAFERLAMIFISDPDAKPRLNRDVLSAVFGLTQQEARVAELLLSGLSQKEVAETLKLTEGTARWHVKNLMSKAAVSRESQLVSKLARALPPVPGAR
ncbi:MAG: helix-turn-helix transcriptional regulator [Amphiplicatus sp.]